MGSIVGKRFFDLVVLSIISEKPLIYLCECLSCGKAVSLPYHKIGIAESKRTNANRACPACVKGFCAVCNDPVTLPKSKKTCSKECAAIYKKQRKDDYNKRNSAKRAARSRELRELVKVNDPEKYRDFRDSENRRDRERRGNNLASTRRREREYYHQNREKILDRKRVSRERMTEEDKAVLAEKNKKIRSDRKRREALSGILSLRQKIEQVNDEYY